MGQASHRKKILQPLNELGLDKITNIEEALKERFGPEEADKITSTWDRLSKEADASQNPGMQNELYDFLNHDFDLSMIVSCYTDAAIIREVCLWIYDHRECFGKEILDVGCGSGMISCFLATLLPDAHITAIDRSAGCIRTAEQIKEKMGVRNIDFRNSSVSEFIRQLEQPFNTVLSVRTFHENIGIRYTDYKFLSFSEQLRTYESIYRDYCTALSQLVSGNGTLICIERNQMDTEFLSVFRVLCARGLQILPESLKELKCKESDFKELSVFQTLIAEKKAVNTYPQDNSDLFQIWSDRAFSNSKDPEYFTRSQTDWYVETNAAELIEGFASFDANGTQLAKACLYQKRDDADHFLMYQANYGKAGVQILPLEALEEAREVFADHKIVDTARGFIVKEL